MDPRYSDRAEAFRARVRDFLDEHLPPDWPGIGALPTEEALAFVHRWRAALQEHRLLAPAWPSRQLDLRAGAHEPRCPQAPRDHVPAGPDGSAGRDRATDRDDGARTQVNEVLFDGARTALGNIVGEVDNGWTVANSLLGLERGDEAATNPVLFRAELDRLVAMARSKLQWSEYHRDVARLTVDVLGARAMVATGRPPVRGFRADDPGALHTTASWIGVLYNAVAGTIYAGTSEVQRNILAERVLGLPREPRPPTG